MYLSRIKLNINEKATVKFLQSPQVAHATIEGAFDDSDRTRKLWRLDYYKGHPYVLLLSHNKPDLASFIEQFGYPDELQEIRDYQRLLDCLQMGQRYHFRLCANPVHSVSQGDDRRGKVMGHVTVAQQEKWLTDRSDRLGFALGEFTVVERHMKKFKRQNRFVTLSTAVYEGILEIQDINIFKETLVKGIGRAKSYGCGLLTLAK